MMFFLVVLSVLEIASCCGGPKLRLKVRSGRKADRPDSCKILAAIGSQMKDPPTNEELNSEVKARAYYANARSNLVADDRWPSDKLMELCLKEMTNSAHGKKVPAEKIFENFGCRHLANLMEWQKTPSLDIPRKALDKRVAQLKDSICGD